MTRDDLMATALLLVAVLTYSMCVFTLN